MRRVRVHSFCKKLCKKIFSAIYLLTGHSKLVRSKEIQLFSCVIAKFDTTTTYLHYVVQYVYYNSIQ